MYLKLAQDFRSRKIIAKFRCSNNNLLIEKGRHKKSLNKNALNATWMKLRTKDILHVSVLPTLIKENYFSKLLTPPSLDHDYLLTYLLPIKKVSQLILCALIFLNTVRIFQIPNSNYFLLLNMFNFQMNPGNTHSKIDIQRGS